LQFLLLRDRLRRRGARIQTAAVLALWVYCLSVPRVVLLYFADQIWLRPETKYQSGVVVYG
ncbi:MAG: hypothetical protein WBO22_04470, partial [Shewanella indica]|uniref:hypothetical protein n=1 Tax=Shewanella indica TaxID=768528 RepID=UPI003C750389